MESRVDEVIKRHHSGYNCSQAVACTYCEDFGFDEVDTFKFMEAFGFGMGAMSTCGAISGACALVGMKYSDGKLEGSTSKRTSYKLMKKIIREFEEKNTSAICREIKGVDTGEVLRSCDGCVYDSAMLVEKYLFSDEEEG